MARRSNVPTPADVLAETISHNQAIQEARELFKMIADGNSANKDLVQRQKVVTDYVVTSRTDAKMKLRKGIVRRFVKLAEREDDFLAFIKIPDVGNTLTNVKM